MDTITTKFDLRPHQKDAISMMHNGCVLWGGVGTGKTITALAYSQFKELGKKINVITTAKVRNDGSWDKEAAKLGIDFNLVTVDSWNKIAEFTDREGEFFIFDEQRLVGSGQWVKSFYKIAAKNHWILLTATPGDTWGDYGPLFVANGYYKNITEFRDTHAVYARYVKFPKIDRWIGEGKLNKMRRDILVEMPMDRHTTRHLEYIECDYNLDMLKDVKKTRWNPYTQEPIQNAAELFSVYRKVVSTDPSRSEMLRDLISKHPRLIVFYNFDYELKILTDLMSEYESSQPVVSSAHQSQIELEPSQLMNSKRSFSEKTTGVDPYIQSKTDQTFLKTTRRKTSEEENLTGSRRTTDGSGKSTVSTTLDPAKGSTLTSVLPKDVLERPAYPAKRELTGDYATQPMDQNQSLWEKLQKRLEESSPTSPGKPTGTSPRKSLSEKWLRNSSAETLHTSASQSNLTLPDNRGNGYTGSLQGYPFGIPDLGMTGPSTTTPKPAESPESSIGETEWASKESTNSRKTSQKEKSGELSQSRSLATSPNLLGSSGSTETHPAGLSATDQSFGWAQYNGHKHQPVPQTNRWVYLVQYQAGAEGWNCIETDSMVFWSLTYSFKQWMQAQGRTDRLNTPFKDLFYYIFMTKSFAEMPVIASLKAKRDFQPK